MMNIALIFIVSAFVAGGTSDPSPTIVPIAGGIHGSAITTRYWDCCKPSCSWRDNINTKAMIPVYSCGEDSEAIIDAKEMSGCDEGGNTFMCNSQVAFEVNSTLAYGFVAASFKGGPDVSHCCACVLLSFKGHLHGKHMVAQIINTGSDVSANRFSIAIPGAGPENQYGCTKQWNAPPDAYEYRTGGVSNEQECYELPEPLQNGCLFDFDFLDGIENSHVKFEQVECPSLITDITGCEP